MNIFFRILALAIFLHSSLKLTAQDLIVTSEGDSLNCKITKQEKGFIYFAFKQADEVKRTVISDRKILSIKRGYYSEDVMFPPVYAKITSYSKWRYGVHAGYSYRTAKVSDQIPSQFRDYIKKLKSGYVVGGDLHYFTSETLGFGLKYNFNKAKSDLGTSLKDDISLNYIGVSLLNRLVLPNENNNVLFGINFGFQSYRDKSVVDFENFNITGKNLGLGLEMGFDHKISPSCALNIGAALHVSSLNKITVDNGFMKETVKLEKEDIESLARIEITVGLKFLSKYK